MPAAVDTTPASRHHEIDHPLVGIRGDEHEARRAAVARRIMVAALAAGVLGDVLLHERPWGIGLPLWGVVMTAAAVLAARGTGISPYPRDRFWVVAAALVFASFLAVRDSAFLVALDLVAVAGLTAVAVMTRWRTSLARLHLVAWIRGLLHSTVDMVGGAVPIIRYVVTAPSEDRPGHSLAVVRGLLVAVPLIVLFGALFASADAVFSERFDSVFDLEAVVSHLFGVVVLTWLAACSLFALLLDTQRSPPDAGPQQRSMLGSVELGIVLGSLAVLFLAFIAVQAQALFGGAQFVQETTGLTYAEYARRGFFELVTVATLLLPLLVALDWLRHDTPRSARLYRGASAALVVLLLIVMATAVSRLLGYVEAFGLTELRLYALAFLGWLALVSAWIAGTVLRGQRERLMLGVTASAVISVAALNVANPDALIARTNLDRGRVPETSQSSRTSVPDSGYDEDYATSLSADAVPVVVSNFNSLDPADQREVARSLLAEWSPGSRDWHTWNLGRERAYDAVRRHEAELRRAAE